MSSRGVPAAYTDLSLCSREVCRGMWHVACGMCGVRRVACRPATRFATVRSASPLPSMTTMFPVGDRKLRVMVTDAVTGAFAYSAVLSFTVNAYTVVPLSSLSLLAPGQPPPSDPCVSRTSI